MYIANLKEENRKVILNNFRTIKSPRKLIRK